MRKLGIAPAWHTLESNRIENIIDTLFPTYHEGGRESDAKTLDNIQLFSENRLSRVANSLQSRKTLGPDVIPTEP